MQNKQQVKIIDGPEKILDFYISRAKIIKEDAKACYDYNGSARIMNTSSIWNTNLEVDKKGINIR